MVSDYYRTAARDWPYQVSIVPELMGEKQYFNGHMFWKCKKSFFVRDLWLQKESDLPDVSSEISYV